MSSIEIIGGTFDIRGGKHSKVLEDIVSGIRGTGIFSSIDVTNGGTLYDLNPRVDKRREAEHIILWMPGVDNREEKLAPIKSVFPKAIAITSKRNDGEKYTFKEVVAHGLNLKSNLILEIRKDGDVFFGRLIDTLGNVWQRFTRDFITIGKALAVRADELSKITRQATVQSPEAPIGWFPTYRTNDFMDFIKEMAGVFERLNPPPPNMTRFMGNASFRCNKGFPSMRLPSSDIFVSQRNVDKSAIDEGCFVQVGWNRKTDTVWYRGDKKPSVDTVIQVRLYEFLPKIKFMLHSHCYIGSSDQNQPVPMTSKMIPCGGLEEVAEIMAVVKEFGLKEKYYFPINLKGHGSILFMAGNIGMYKPFSYIPRPYPEEM